MLFFIDLFVAYSPLRKYKLLLRKGLCLSTSLYPQRSLGVLVVCLLIEGIDIDLLSTRGSSYLNLEGNTGTEKLSNLS